MIGGYANEVACYVCTDDFFPPTMTGGSYEGGWDVDRPDIAGGSMTVYGHLGHFHAHSDKSSESLFIASLDGLLA
jgi:neutral ceramidase